MPPSFPNVVSGLARALWTAGLCAVLSLATPFPDVHAQGPPPAARFAPQKALAAEAQRIKDLLDALANRVAQGAAIDAERKALREHAGNLGDLDEALQEAFVATESRIKEAGLPDFILERHYATVADYEKNLEVLTAHLDAVDAAAGKRAAGRDEDLAAAVKAARRYLRRHKAKDAPRFLSGNSLPYAAMKQTAEPRDISHARAAVAEQRSIPRVSAPPTAADLAATIDVQLTEEVEELAAELQTPLAMYRHVRDNMRFEPYTGSRKGSRETILVKGGNDYDIASALIALLRASGVPARYVSGQVLMPADRVMNWLGVTDGFTAANILATAGMQPTPFTDNGEVVAIGFEHVWVIAYLPYGNYRGIGNDDTGMAWVPLDPSFKSLEYTDAVDIPSEMGFDAQEFIDGYISTFHEPSPVELYLQNIADYVATERKDLTFPDDVFRTATIVPDESGILPASLPFEQLAAASEFAAIAQAERHRIRFHIRNGNTTLLDHTLDLPAIASRRVTISYDPATAGDAETIETYGDLYATPPNLIALKPVLRVEGAAVATGTSIGAGVLHNSDMHFLTPAGESNVVPLVQNFITAGTYQGIGIDTWRVPDEALVPPDDEELPDTDGLTGEKLYRTAMNYLDRVDRAGLQVAQTQQMVVQTAVSEAIVENVVQVFYNFSQIPVAWEWKGLIVDADRKIIGPFAIDGDESKEKPYFVLTGADASIGENRVFEDLYGEEAVSTIKILELASDMGIEICRIVTSIATDCPAMSQPAPVVAAVNGALAQGHEVTIPRTQITYLNWTGTGYIDMDPDTGAAGYIISGGQSGGATVDSWSSTWQLFFAVFGRDVCNIIAVILSPEPNSYFPYPGANGGPMGVTPSSFEVDYTVYYCDPEEEEVTVSETYIPHFQYPPGNFVFHAGWGTGETLAFTVFDVQIIDFLSDQYMARGYTGPPVAGDPDPASIRYLILPVGFTPQQVQMKVANGAEIKTQTEPNSSGILTATFDGKNNGGSYINAGSYHVRFIVTAPDGQIDRSEDMDLHVVEVTDVALLDTGGAALTGNAHPDKPGGRRIFAGKPTKDAADRGNRVKVRATLSMAVPAGKMKVNLVSFDVADPTGLIDANHGEAMGTPAEGMLSDQDPATTGSNEVWVDFTTTMQPGDNFKIFASTNKKMIDNLTDAIAEANTDEQGATMNARLMPLASERLTVWRRVHVERDSMGNVASNRITGSITAVTNNGNGTSTVTTDQNFTETPSATNRFANGLLRRGMNAFRVVGNTDGMNMKVTVNNLGMTIPTAGAFTLVDDDDYNGNDGTSQDGDDGEDVAMASIGKIQDSDDGSKNVFAYAYVRPTFDIGDNNSSVAFVANTPDGADEKSLLLATYDFDAAAYEADKDFWTVYFLGAYQMQTEEDGDGAGSTTFGQVDELNGQGASVFLEATKESPGPACNEPDVGSHELGHLFKGAHTDTALMDGGGCNVGPLTFSDISLRKIRNLDHP
ncbi:MAG TPA: transglutaminase-like domain-containing protein [Candidatus Limnocylindrales bacterium]|nr:transglutaminase-like domain-containing protein [Candidatus Limnocylindrales bacterium]